LQRISRKEKQKGSNTGVGTKSIHAFNEFLILKRYEEKLASRKGKRN
jgi:hypothetical protein